jgi:hypothetical protein
LIDIGCVRTSLVLRQINTAGDQAAFTLLDTPHQEGGQHNGHHNLLEIPKQQREQNGALGTGLATGPGFWKDVKGLCMVDYVQSEYCVAIAIDREESA